MKIAAALLAFLAPLGAAQAAGPRVSCDAGQHQLVFDFARGLVTLDGKTDAMKAGAATWRGTPGGHAVIVTSPDAAKPREYDISIDSGTTYSGFVLCRPT